MSQFELVCVQLVGVIPRRIEIKPLFLLHSENYPEEYDYPMVSCPNYTRVNIFKVNLKVMVKVKFSRVKVLHHSCHFVAIVQL